jgi:hypothetical protein
MTPPEKNPHGTCLVGTPSQPQWNSSLCSIGWRRGPGRGGLSHKDASILSPLPRRGERKNSSVHLLRMDARNIPARSKDVLTFDESLPRRDIPIIARRFNAGMLATPGRVPKGRLKDGANSCPFSRPVGTRILSTTIPALKRWAIFICPSGTCISKYQNGIQVSATPNAFHPLRTDCFASCNPASG